MFVDSQFRGAKIGRALGEVIIRDAGECGYSMMRLNTLSRHYAALGLYPSLGFNIVPLADDALKLPEDLPEDLKGGVISMVPKL